MPDRTKRRVGDHFRLLAVPQCDLDHRRSEIAEKAEGGGWTADTIERIIAMDSVVTIDRIDKYGAPGFDAELEESDGVHYHALSILDDDFENVSGAYVVLSPSSLGLR